MVKIPSLQTSAERARVEATGEESTIISHSSATMAAMTLQRSAVVELIGTTCPSHVRYPAGPTTRRTKVTRLAATAALARALRQRRRKRSEERRVGKEC